MPERSGDGPTPLEELLADAPSNWGRWGPDDEIGAANFLTAAEVLAGVAAVRSGKVFTLQVPMGNPKGDPIWPGRGASQRLMVIDRSHFAHDRVAPFPGGIEYADDHLSCFLQGTTHCDALGHAWYGDEIWNGYPAESTIGRMDQASVLPLAKRGIVGRGVLLDVARWRGRDYLEPGDTFDHEDLEACAAAQNVELRPHDVLVVRTGWLRRFFEVGSRDFYKGFNEPGLTHSPALVRWFHEREVPALVTDTMANEVTIDPASGAALPLHGALMRNLGVVFMEMAWLEELGEDCVDDDGWDFLFTAAPLKVTGATGAPVNPVVVK